MMNFGQIYFWIKNTAIRAGSVEVLTKYRPTGFRQHTDESYVVVERILY